MKRWLGFSVALAAAAVGSFLANPVSAEPSVWTNIYALPSVGVGASQVLQVDLANVSEPVDPTRTTLVVQGRLLDADGNELARSATRTLRRGASFHWTITRAMFASLTPDERGRVRLRVEVDVTGTPRVGAYVPSVEVVDELTGTGNGPLADTRTVISAQAAYASANAGLFE
jgi:hypothetical protein